jgi:hypothetical protein
MGGRRRARSGPDCGGPSAARSPLAAGKPRSCDTNPAPSFPSPSPYRHSTAVSGFRMAFVPAYSSSYSCSDFPALREIGYAQGTPSSGKARQITRG